MLRVSGSSDVAYLPYGYYNYIQDKLIRVLASLQSQQVRLTLIGLPSVRFLLTTVLPRCVLLFVMDDFIDEVCRHLYYYTTPSRPLPVMVLSLAQSRLYPTLNLGNVRITPLRLSFSQTLGLSSTSSLAIVDTLLVHDCRYITIEMEVYYILSYESAYIYLNQLFRVKVKVPLRALGSCLANGSECWPSLDRCYSEHLTPFYFPS